MFIILVYDVGQKRVGKVLKRCRKYLSWVQNSVLEGEITEVSLAKLKFELDKLIDHNTDSIIIYKLRQTKYTSCEIMGLRKGGEDLII